MALYDGPDETSPIITKHCGQTKPDPDTFVSSSNQMYVRLKADGSVSGKGFKANYTWVREIHNFIPQYIYGLMPDQVNEYSRKLIIALNIHRVVALRLSRMAQVS